MTNQVIPADLRRLAGRLATERTRSAEWHEANLVRRWVVAQLGQGVSRDVIEAELQHRIQEAIASQRHVGAKQTQHAER